MTDWYDHRSTVRSYKTTTYDKPIPDWHQESACGEAAQDPAMAAAWTSDWHPLMDEAKEICVSCPVRKLCLEAAISDPTTEGINGGFEFAGGRMLREDAEAASKVLGRRIARKSSILRNRPSYAAQRPSL